MQMANNKKNIKYQQAVQELDDILGSLQDDTVDVDKVSARVKRAIELIKVCKQKIRKTEVEVKDMVEQFQEDQE
jgi:exodeoxyribonuclease VII small subunit